MTEQETVLKEIKSLSDSAYVRYIDKVDRDLRGLDKRVEDGKVTAEDLANLKKAWELYGKHVGLVEAYKIINGAK